MKPCTFNEPVKNRWVLNISRNTVALAFRLLKYHLIYMLSMVWWAADLNLGPEESTMVIESGGNMHHLTKRLG